MKQVPTAEYFPYEAVQTNVGGAENVVRAIREQRLAVQVVVGVSTDKACQPVNVMGMTKAIAERVFGVANLTLPATRFVGVRYGNVLASRGSVIPLFQDQIRAGGPVTITSPDMTRFLLPLERAVEAVLDALEGAAAGENWVPRAPSARIVDVAAALIGDREVPTRIIGIRPGEKVHEALDRPGPHRSRAVGRIPHRHRASSGPLARSIGRIRTAGDGLWISWWTKRWRRPLPG